jgi:hypothetical protein
MVEAKTVKVVEATKKDNSVEIEAYLNRVGF